MTCAEFREIARDAARGAMDVAVREHLDGCAVCRARFEDERALSGRLAVLAGSMEGLSAPPRIERSLRQAFRGKHGRPAASWKWLGWSAPVIAAAAGVFVLYLLRPQPVQPLGGPDPLPRLAAKAPEVRPAPPVAVQAARPVLAARRFRPAVRPQEIPQFVPVRFAPPLLPGEAAEVIRVSLPGAAMRRFGVYVPAEVAVRRVSADVLMGEDGVARAIRFVH